MIARAGGAVAFLLLLALAVPIGDAKAADEGGFKRHHKVTLLAGYAFERKRGKDEETGALGSEYAYRFDKRFSAGAFIELLGTDTVRDVATGVLLGWHPAGGWTIFAGPGMEFTPKKDEVLFRLGTSYKFDIADKWSLGPEAIFDQISGGKQTFILGLALSRKF